MLTEIEKNPACDGFIIGCFDDTGLTEARLISRKPIIGIGQSAFHMAALRHGKFCVLTTLEISIPVIKQNSRTFGISWKRTFKNKSGYFTASLSNNRLENNFKRFKFSPKYLFAIIS